jgi:hypothetical protein
MQPSAMDFNHTGFGASARLLAGLSRTFKGARR